MKRMAAATAIALTIAVSGTGVGFASPPTDHHLGLAAAATSSAQRSLGSDFTVGTSIALKKVNLKKITTNNLNLRKGRGTNTKVLLTVPRNTAITVVETSGTWSKTTYKKKTGWVASRYLKNAPAAKKPQAKPKAYGYTTGFTTLRKSATTKSQALSVHQRRTKVESISVSGSWTKVKVGGRTGYMASSHLSKKNPAVVHRWLKSKQVVRNTTGKRFKVVTTAQKNTKVEWLRTKGSWAGIRTAKGDGWVPTSALAKSAAKAPAKPPAKATYRWTTANVNVRKGAGTSHASLGTVPINERVTYLKSANGWSNVKTSRGTGWISKKYLATSGQHSFAVYGTLRKGQSAYHVLKGRTTKETKTQVPSFTMYLKPHQTWWSFIIPSNSASHKVVVERMDIKPALYKATMRNLDSWERFDPTKPLADQNYNRKLVTDKDGRRSWAYVGASKISKYLTKNGIRVTSGDYLKRF